LVFFIFWKPAAVTGAGGTAAAVWFEGLLLFSQEILALIFLPILSGLIYMLDIFIFKSCTPRREDRNDIGDKGASK
jgi:hypothetical protein